MAKNTRRMAADRLAALRAQWVELNNELEEARIAHYAAKDRDDLFTTLMSSNMFNEAEEYGNFMQEAKRKLK